MSPYAIRLSSVFPGVICTGCIRSDTHDLVTVVLQEFWGQDAWKDDESEYSSEADQKDVFDSDFNESGAHKRLTFLKYVHFPCMHLDVQC